MVHISHPIGAATAGKYYAEHYSSAAGQYYTEGHAGEGQWHGKLAAEMGLAAGGVKGEAFERIVNGQDPVTGEQLIVHRETQRAKDGKELGHRAAWDLVLQPDKSVSLTALVGGDEAVRAAHRMSVTAALAAGETYTQARGGGDRPAITTGKWLVAVFEHDTARPERLNESNQESLYPAPHLHSHAVLVNLTIADKARSLQTAELFKAQQLIKAVYQSEMKYHLRVAGYEVHEGKNGAAEIQGYTKEYLAAESLRSTRIKERLEELGLNGRRAEEIVAHQNRNEKLDLSPEEVRALHLARAKEFGNQPQKVVEAAGERKRQVGVEVLNREHSPGEAVTFAKRSITERLAVFDHFALVSEALKYGRGYVRVQDVEANVAARSIPLGGRAPEFVVVAHGRPNTPGRQYTSQEMIASERDVLAMTKAGRFQVEPLAAAATEQSLKAEYQYLHNGLGLNANQLRAAVGLLKSPDRITGLQGSAGTGKTTSTLRVVTDYAKAAGLEIVGLAPTGRARKELEAAGISAQTLQGFLTRIDRRATELHQADSAKTAESTPRLFIVDESSLVSTKQYQELLKQLRPGDRVLEVGDIRQHESVEAARIFHEQQLAGMRTETLTKIVRQQTPEMVSVVELLQQGKAASALRILGEQKRVDVVERRKDRLHRIANDYAASPQGTLVISPDNASRKELNQLIREKLQAAGSLGPDLVSIKILVARQDLTKEDRKLAGSYEMGTVVQFQTGSKALGTKAKEYGTVLERNTQANTVTVQSGEKVITYNPKAHHGVQLFEPELRDLGVGDQVVFRKGWKERAIITGDRATIEAVDRKGNVKAVLEEKGRRVDFNLRDMPHLDYAYASTSYTAQGATAERVLVHMETSGKGAKALLTAAMAYVALSRPRQEMRVYTDDTERLERMLQNNEVKQTALAPKQMASYGMSV